jgi:arylsulfatase A-like enzyme
MMRFYLFILLLLTAHPIAAQTEPTTKPAYVLVMSLDGTRPDGLLQAETPNLQDLARRGAVDWSATTIFPSVTLPAHTSMLTGLSPEDHGVDWNDRLTRCEPVIEAPTFLTMTQEAGYRTAMVVGKAKFCHLWQSEAVDFTFAQEGDRSVADRVIELLQADYQVIFAHFPNPDFFGHSEGWMSDIYINELYSTDYQVGRVLAELENLGIADETLVIITTDHGGHGTSHGQDMPEDMQIPWIIAGPGVIPETILESEVNVADTAATVLWALELPIPENILGRPVTEAFDVESTPESP